MAVGGQYTVQLRAMIDTKGVLAQIAQIQRQAGKIMIGGAGATKGAGFAAMGKDANRTAAGVRRLGAAVEDTNKKVKKVGYRGNGSQFQQMGKDAKQASSDVKQSAGALKNFGSTTLDVTKKVIQFGAVTAAIRGVTQGIGSMVQQTFELDSALTEFKKVSDLSGKGLEKYTKQAYEAGEATAKTGVEMIDAATQFRKMGYGDQQAMQLANYATMFQNIADAEISAGDAAKFINSQMKAFGKEFAMYSTEGEKAAKVIDTVNEVANKNAVGTNDLQLALTKTSASMQGYGNSFNEVVGIMTAGTEIMVGQPSIVARGWRTIAANVLAAAQKSDVYTAANGKVNVSMRKSNGELKNTYEIMKSLYEGQEGVSKGWKELGEEEQSLIAVELAGKQNQDKFRAVMDNFATAIKATTDAEGAHGSAMKENARYLESLEGRLQAVKSAWSRFSNAMVKSDVVKSVLSGLAKALNLLASDAGQAMIKAGLAVGAFVGAVKILNAIRGATVFASLISGAGNFAREIGISTKALGRFKMALGGMSSASLLGLAAVAGVIAVGMYKAYKQTHKYRNEVKALSKANEDNIEAIDKNAKSAEFYADKIEELSKVENKTNAEKERMAAYVKKLNELMPGLNLEYDKEKDALNKTTDAVREYIKAKQEEAKIKAYQENFEKSLNEQVKLEEKRKKALEDFQAAQKQYDEASKIGYVDPMIDKNLQKAKKGLYDVTQAYISASKETAKQSNNMVKASGDWEKLAQTARVSGTKISDSLVQGIEDGVYLIPEKLDDVKSLASFDDLAQKLNASSAGKSVVEALQQGMREGDINVNDALKIAQQMQDLSLIMDKEGRQAVEELSNQFARGEIDFSQLQNGFREALGGVKDFDLGYFHNAMKEAGQSTEDVVNRLKQITEAHPDAKITIGGVELAEEQVSTVIDYLSKVDGDDADATIEIDGSEVAVKDIESVEDLLDKIKGKTYKGKMKLEGGEETAEQAETASDKAKDFAGGNYDASMTLSGGEEVADQAKTASDSADNFQGVRVATFKANTNKALKQYKDLKKSQDDIKEQKTSTITTKVSGKSAWTGIKSLWDSLKDKVVNITTRKSTVNAGSKSGKGGSVPGRATGTRNAPEGLAEVNERGWEFIRDAKTGQLRVAGGGKRTVTMLNKGDAVYTHQESKRMLSDARSIEIPQHAKGKKSKKAEAKKKAQEAYNKAYEKRKSSYEAAVDKLEHQAVMKHWSDKTLASKINKLYKKRIASLKKWNKSKKVKKWVKKGAKTKKSFGRQPNYSRLEGVENANYDIRINQIEKDIESLGLGSGDPYLDKNEADSKISNLNSLLKKKKISAEDYKKYYAEINKAYIDSALKMYKAGKKNYTSMKADLDDYVKTGKITWAEYYEYIEDLMDSQLENEKKRLEKEQKLNDDTYSLARAGIERQIAERKKEIEATEEQNELIEKQNDLEKARSQRVKVYRQGKGFVYEQDTQAIKEATTALKDYKKEQDPLIKELEEILELFDDFEAQAEMTNLERLVGNTFENLFGGYGTDKTQWIPFLKENLATKYGLENLLEEMGELNGWEAIQNFLDANGVVTESTIEDSIAKNRFASDTLSAPAGFARVAENGYEIALLSQGDAVMPHNVSENLMAWGAHSPIEYASAMANNTSNSYYFDKLVLPNVSDANSLLRELNNLPNKALQYSRSRA